MARVASVYRCSTCRTTWPAGVAVCPGCQRQMTPYQVPLGAEDPEPESTGEAFERWSRERDAA